MEEETETIESEKKKPKSKEKLIKIFAVIGVIVGIVILIIIKSQKPDFPLKWILLIGCVVLVVGLGFFFGFDLFRKYSKHKEKKKENDGLPEPASQEVLLQRLYKAITNTNLKNHRKGGYIPYTYNLGKNEIQEYYVELEYEDKILGNSAYIFINKHYPNDEPTIIPGDATKNQRTYAANSMSKSPEPTPDIEEITTISPITGATTTHKKISRKKKEESKKKEMKEEIG